MILLVCVIGVALLFSPTLIFATVHFSDGFGDDLAKWENVSGQNNGVDAWRLDSGNLISEVNRHSYSFLYAKDTSGLGDYVLTTRVMNISGVDQHFLFRVAPDKSSYYQLELRYGDPWWQTDRDAVRLWRFRDGVYSLVMSDIPYTLTQNVWHDLRIELSGINIKVYVDNNLVVDIDDDTSVALSGGGVGLGSYAGDYFYSNVVNRYDDFQITSNDSESIRKIIIVPGLGASWNAEALVLNQTAGDDQWKMTPFVHNYDGLVKALEDNGLANGSDFWVWNYDWRLPLNEIVGKFDSFIEGKIDTGERVDLVGHSLGGLVARNWAQEHVADSRVGEVISLGSPHQGTVKAYDVWSGAKISDKPDVSSVALNVLLQLQRYKYPTRLETIRGMAPVLKDILPTFDFAKRNGSVVVASLMETKNDYLVDKNLDVEEVYDHLWTVAGIGQLTKEWVSLGERSVFDKTLGLWPDGRVLSYTYNEGDGTVLQKSSVFEDDEHLEITSDHGAIIDEAVAEILDKLGLDRVSIIKADSDLADSLVFYLGSPANMGVKCDNEPKVLDNRGFVVIHDNNYQKCVVTIEGTGGGTYHLVMGKSDNEESWRYFEDEIGLGQIKTLVVNGQGVDLAMDASNLAYLYDLISRDANYLLANFKDDTNLNGIITAAMNRKADEVATKLFSFRKTKRESIISQRMLEVLKSILAINNVTAGRQTAVNSLTRITRLKNLVDYNTKVYIRRGWVPGQFGSLSYNYLDKLTEEAKLKLERGEYGGVVGNDLLVQKLYGEVW